MSCVHIHGNTGVLVSRKESIVWFIPLVCHHGIVMVIIHHLGYENSPPDKGGRQHLHLSMQKPLRVRFGRKRHILLCVIMLRALNVGLPWENIVSWHVTGKILILIRNDWKLYVQIVMTPEEAVAWLWITHVTILSSTFTHGDKKNNPSLPCSASCSPFPSSAVCVWTPGRHHSDELPSFTGSIKHHLWALFFFFFFTRVFY